MSPRCRSSSQKISKTKTALFQIVFDIVPVEKEKKFRGRKPKGGRPKEFLTEYKVVIKESKLQIRAE